VEVICSCMKREKIKADHGQARTGCFGKIRLGLKKKRDAPAGRLYGTNLVYPGGADRR
jgi:hypothetical protein